MAFNKPYRRRGNRKPVYRRKNRKLAPKRRVYRRRRYMTNKIQPNIAYVKMKYSTTITLDAAQGSVNSYLFRANSIYDPDYSGTGHQPGFHDLYATLYDHYEVLGSKIVVRPLPAPETTAGQTGARLCQLSISLVRSDTESNPGIESIREFKRGPVMFVNDNSVVNGPRSTIAKGWSKRMWYGKETPQSTGAAFGSNPAAPAYFSIQQSAPSADFNPIVLTCLVDMYFTVRLTKPITQTQS